MKELLKRFVREEDADLSAWITVILLIMITILVFIVVWPLIRKQMNNSYRDTDVQLKNIADNANNGINNPKMWTGLGE